MSALVLLGGILIAHTPAPGVVLFDGAISLLVDLPYESGVHGY